MDIPGHETCPPGSELPALLEYARDTQIAEPRDPSRDVHAPSGSFFVRYRMAVALFGAQLVLLAVAAPGYSAHGLEIAWGTITPQLGAQLIFAFLWWHFRKYATHPTKHAFRDVVLAAALLVLLTNIASPAQYVAISLKRPLIDSWLARADAAIGVHVPALVLWTSAHGKVSLLLTLCYFSLLPQFLLPLLIVGLWARNRAALWEYIFHFHFCLLVTVASLALFPAACAFQYYGFTATLTEARFIAQFNGVRDGTFHIIRFNDLEGLISMPSFHVAGALMVTWACRKYRYLLIPLVVLNTGLIASTFFSGAHYFIDIVASFALFAISVVVYRCWGARLVDASAPLA